MAAPLLHFKDISKKYSGIPVLESIDLEIERGEVLALIGANGAGKSTLMNILGGVVQADSGWIEIEGQRIQIRNPSEAIQHGIAFVHQELTVLDSLSVMDNILLASYPSRAGVINMQEARARCSQVLERLNCTVALNEKIRNLSPGDQQLIEIARVLIQDPRILIFDEPTSSLSKTEKNHLFGIIKKLRDDSVTIIYITHLLDELEGLCSQVCVLRNGRLISRGAMGEYTRQRLIAELTGEDTHVVSRAAKSKSGVVLLEVRGFNRNKIFTDINFDLHRGEILGIWGLLGAGRTELIRALVGLDPIDSGSLRWQKKDGFVEINPQQLGKRVGLITEDRRREGLFLPMSVRKNLSVANLKKLQRPPTPFIDSGKEAQISSDLISQLNIKVASSNQAVRTLSGGNQQKVIIGRWLAKDPDLYIMDEPIKGIDVSAKAEIKRIILDLTNKGKSVLLISSELEEIVGFCDRYLVLCKGHLTAELPAEATPRQLMDAATSLQVLARQVEEVVR